MKQIVEYEIEDIGVDNDQYFPGRGTTYSRWDEVSVGIGDNPAEALDDALDSLAQGGWATESVKDELPGSRRWRKSCICPRAQTPTGCTTTLPSM